MSHLARSVWPTAAFIVAVIFRQCSGAEYYCQKTNKTVCGPEFFVGGDTSACYTHVEAGIVLYQCPKYCTGLQHIDPPCPVRCIKSVKSCLEECGQRVYCLTGDCFPNDRPCSQCNISDTAQCKIYALISNQLRLPNVIPPEPFPITKRPPVRLESFSQSWPYIAGCVVLAFIILILLVALMSRRPQSRPMIMYSMSDSGADSQRRRSRSDYGAPLPPAPDTQSRGAVMSNLLAPGAQRSSSRHRTRHSPKPGARSPPNSPARSPRSPLETKVPRSR